MSVFNKPETNRKSVQYIGCFQVIPLHEIKLVIKMH